MIETEGSDKDVNISSQICFPYIHSRRAAGSDSRRSILVSPGGFIPYFSHHGLDLIFIQS